MKPEYYRQQAAICLRLAEGASNSEAGVALKEIAADYEKRAAELERQGLTSPSSKNKDEKAGDQ